MARGANLPRGTEHWNSRLTEDQVRQIKLALAAGEVQQRIADRFDVSRALVGLIAQGRRWKDVY